MKKKVAKKSPKKTSAASKRKDLKKMTKSELKKLKGGTATPQQVWPWAVTKEF